MQRFVISVLLFTCIACKVQTVFANPEPSNPLKLQQSGYVVIDADEYYLELEPQVWSNASEICSSLNMSLISLNTEEKETLIIDWLVSQGLGEELLWSSGVKSLGVWIWVGIPEALSYTRWYPGEPNDVSAETCLHFQATYGWFDFSCDYDYPFMCE